MCTNIFTIKERVSILSIDFFEIDIKKETSPSNGGVSYIVLTIETDPYNWDNIELREYTFSSLPDAILFTIRLYQKHYWWFEGWNWLSLHRGLFYIYQYDSWGWITGWEDGLQNRLEEEVEELNKEYSLLKANLTDNNEVNVPDNDPQYYYNEIPNNWEETPTDVLITKWNVLNSINLKLKSII
jgi:hypothetical protein